jgi:rubredoxin
MPTAVALEDVEGTLVRQELEGGGVRRRSFIETRQPGSPQAFIVQYDPNRHSRAHFHEVDQFQIIVEGKGKIGRHELRPYSVHFARAHTPYGPLVSDAEGMTFVTLRRRCDFGGAQRLPESKAVLEQIPNRKPWQVTEGIDFGRLPAMPHSGVLVEPIPGVKDDKGLAGYVVSMLPNAVAYAPDPSRGEGQFVLILEGSLLYGAKEHKAITVVSVDADEGPFQMQAGAHGLKGLVLSFPRGEATHAVAAEAPDTGLKTWQCLLCAFVYKEAEGLPEEGIAAGTRWQDVPEGWSCPDCAASKADFQMAEI